MKTVPAAFLTMLNSSKNLVRADLYTITLRDGSVLRYTSADVDINYGGNWYLSGGPQIDITASATDFPVAAGATSAWLVDNYGRRVIGAPSITAIHLTNWQGRVALSDVARTQYCGFATDFTGWSNQSVYTVTGVASIVPGETASKLICTGVFANTASSVTPATSTGDFTVVYYLESFDAVKTTLTIRDATNGNNLNTTTITWADASIHVSGHDPAASSTVESLGEGPNGGALLRVTLHASMVDGAAKMYSFMYPDNSSSSTTGIIFHACLIENESTAGSMIPNHGYTPVTVTDYVDNGDGTVGLGQAAASGDGYDWDGTGPVRSNAPAMTRGKVSTQVGLSVDTLQMGILYDATTRINNLTPASFIAFGGFDECLVDIDVAMAPDWSNPTVNGVVNLFTGIVAESKIQGGKIQLTVNSPLRLLNTQFPRNYFLPGCNHSLFDAGCGLSAATYAFNGTVAATPTPTRSTFGSNATQADGYYDLGYIKWTSGANAGTVSAVKSYLNGSGQFTVIYPLAAAPASGDTFTAYPGCDKTLLTCNNKFNNKSHFRGFPFVPTPEMIELGGRGSTPIAGLNNSSGGASFSGIPRGPGGRFGSFELR